MASAHAEHPAVAWVALALAGAGMALTAYLTGLRWLGEHPPYCGAGTECDIVQESRWSTLLGVPLSAWGFLLYAALLFCLWRLRRRPAAWTRAITVAVVGFGISVYLTAVSIFAIEATCGYCLASFAIITAILAILLVRGPAGLPSFRWGAWTTGALGATALIVATLHLHYGGVFDPAAGPEKPYLRELALHLDATGSRFYGAYWCPRCTDQKALFEASVDRLPYVECTPHGRKGPRASACALQQIEHYPTWIINGRRHEGVLEPATLARLSGFRWDGPGGP